MDAKTRYPSVSHGYHRTQGLRAKQPDAQALREIGAESSSRIDGASSTENSSETRSWTAPSPTTRQRDASGSSPVKVGADSSSEYVFGTDGDSNASDDTSSGSSSDTSASERELRAERFFSYSTNAVENEVGAESESRERIRDYASVAHIALPPTAYQMPQDELESFMRYAAWATELDQDLSQDWRAAKEGKKSLSSFCPTVRWINAMDRFSLAIKRYWDGNPKGKVGPYNLVSYRLQSSFYPATLIAVALRYTLQALLVDSRLCPHHYSAEQLKVIQQATLAATVAGGIIYLPHILTMFREWVRGRAGELQNKLTVLTRLEGALNFVTRGDKATRQDSEDFSEFVRACRRIPELSKAANYDSIKNKGALYRDLLVLPVNVTSSVVAQVAIVMNWPKSAGVGTMAASGVAFFFQSGLDSWQGRSAEVPRSEAQIESASKRIVRIRNGENDRQHQNNADVRYRLSDDSIRALTAAATTVKGQSAALITRQKLEVVGGWFRFGKAVGGTVVGALSLAVSMYQLYQLLNPAPATNQAETGEFGNGTAVVDLNATQSGPPVCKYGSATALMANAGIFVNMLSHTVNLIYLPLTTHKMKKRGDGSNEGKYRQRIAQYMIARYSRKELIGLIESGNGLKIAYPKGKFGDHRTGFGIVTKEYRPCENEYLGLHLAALEVERELLEYLNGTIPSLSPSRGVACWLHKVFGMPQTEISSMLRQARYVAPLRRLDLIKSQLAPWFGTMFRVNQHDGREKSMKASTIWDVALCICDDNEVVGDDYEYGQAYQGRNKKYAEQDYWKIRKQLHEAIPPEDFILAVNKLWNVHKPGLASDEAKSELRMLHCLAQAAEADRLDQLSRIANALKRGEKLYNLLASSNVGHGQLQDFATLFRKYSAISVEQVKAREKTLRQLALMPQTQWLIDHPDSWRKLACGEALGAVLDQIDRPEPAEEEDDESFIIPIEEDGTDDDISQDERWTASAMDGHSSNRTNDRFNSTTLRSQDSSAMVADERNSDDVEDRRTGDDKDNIAAKPERRTTEGRSKKGATRTMTRQRPVIVRYDNRQPNDPVAGYSIAQTGQDPYSADHDQEENYYT